MSKTSWLAAGLAAVVAVVILGPAWAAPGAADKPVPATKPALPEAVAKAFRAEFPKGEIVKAEEEKENGVTVYDIEFTEAGVHREADIAADGTILEVSIAVEAKQVPEAALKAIQKAAETAAVLKIEKAEIRCETKDGKVVKLDKVKTNFEAELKKGDQIGEITVDEQGNVVEALKWEAAAKDEKPHTK
jgi:uncharacterized membrane protein YkoI